MLVRTVSEICRVDRGNMKLAILLGVLTIALHFWANSQAEKYGPDIGRHWLVTGDKYSCDKPKNG